MMKSFAFLALVVVATGQIWTPSHEPGFIYRNGHSDAPVKIEAFMNLLCRDSKDRYQPLLNMVDSFTPNRVQLRFHLYPLPYHTYAFYAAKGAFVYENVTRRSAFEWFAAVYNIMDTFKKDRTFYETTASVLSRLADEGQILGADRDQFFNLMENDDSPFKDAILAWKYGASRGIHTTPTIFINGVQFQGADPQMPEIEEVNQKIRSLLAAYVS